MSINGVPDKMVLELEKLEQTAMIRLFDIDMTELGGTIYRFHNGLNENDKNVTWQGYEYQGFPSKIDGIKRSSQGASNRPTLTLSNITGIVRGLYVKYKEMAGATVYVRDVYAKFLDASNFKDGINPNEDLDQEYVTIYEIQGVNSIGKQYATFELSLPVEADNALIPKNVITCTACQWRYRKEGCDYSGNNYFDRYGNPVSSIDEDVCGKLERDCKLRFGDGAIPIRIFPSANKVGR